jgi:uncharacterized protein YndB with AHSA1/START domain
VNEQRTSESHGDSDGRDDRDDREDRVDPRDYGDLDRHDARWRLRVVRRLPLRPDQVWPALTEPARLAAWFPTTIEGDRVAGATLRFAFADLDLAPFDGVMLAFEPESLMELVWAGERLRFELAPDGGETRLSFSDLFDKLGKAARDAAGWHVALDSLAYEAVGQTAPWAAFDRWRAIHPDYVARFGPEASAIGPPEAWERVHGNDH